MTFAERLACLALAALLPAAAAVAQDTAVEFASSLHPTILPIASWPIRNSPECIPSP
jgi:hypothetical protein